MARKRVNRYSGIGGQAVLEGVMMKNQEKYAVAVRKPNGEIAVELENYQGLLHGSKIKEIPFIRGIFNFIDSLVLGMKCLNYSASFYEEDEEEEKLNKAADKVSGGHGEKLMTTLITVISLVFAIGIFVVLPFYLASLLKGYLHNESLMAIIEGVLRIIIFLLYVWGISAMQDIKRLYRYHGAEHKCINCIEKGRPLTVHNVMRSSRLHRRCGTSFIFFVLFVSIILFFFIRVDNPVEKVILRILLMPVIAGISYEIIRLAGRTDNIFIRIISAPGMWIQRMTTKEPDKGMIEVAIAAVEAVFDWKKYLYDNFGYEVDEKWMQEENMGLEFMVNEAVLIPRQDTEILVEEALKNLHDGMRILDLCTGSGCILISLLYYSNQCSGVGIDISGEALRVARENAERLLDGRKVLKEIDGQVAEVFPADFLKSDLTEAAEGDFDMIVSNPPYIESKVIETLMPEVREHEPMLALDGSEDGLLFYRRIVGESRQVLKPGGMLLFEIGYNQGAAVKKLMEDAGYLEVQVVKDYAGLDRVVTGVLGISNFVPAV